MGTTAVMTLSLPIHVLCASDRAFLRHIPVMLSSLRAHASASLRVSIVGSDWRKRDQEQLQAALPDLPLEFLSLPISAFTDLAHKTVLSPMSYARLLMADLVDSDRFLYLDVDMIIRADIAELWAIDLGDSPAAAVFADGLNSGLLLVNARVWRERGLGQKILEWARVHKPREADQEATENVIGPEMIRLDPRWNRQVDAIWGAPVFAFPNYREDAAVLHFVTGFKPWNLGRWVMPRAYADEWRSYQRPNGLPVVWRYEVKTLLWQLSILIRRAMGR